MPYSLPPSLPLIVVAPAAVERRVLVDGVVPRVATLAAGLAALEGPYSVRGRYYARVEDAVAWRRWEAEALHARALRGEPAAVAECRQLRQRLAVATLAARTCPWCGTGTPRDAKAGVAVGGRTLHPSCADALDTLLAPSTDSEV